MCIRDRFEDALKHVRTLAANKGRILFVGTKRQARDIVKEEASRAGCAYVNHRWLGGMLTNFKTVKQSIKRLHDFDAMLLDGSLDKFGKKEALGYKREIEKLERSIGAVSYTHLDVYKRQVNIRIGVKFTTTITAYRNQAAVCIYLHVLPNGRKQAIHQLAMLFKKTARAGVLVKVGFD